MAHRLAMIALLLAAVAPANAQDRSVGITYAPILSLHDESVCCMAAGAWITIDRLHVEYVAAWDHYWQQRRADYAGRLSPFTVPDTVVDGQATTVLWALRSWRTPRWRTRLDVGGRYGTAVEPSSLVWNGWSAGGGVTVDYGPGPLFVRGAIRYMFPKPPEFRIGIGVRF